MMDLADIFATEPSTTVFGYGSAALLAINAIVVMCIAGRTRKQSGEL